MLGQALGTGVVVDATGQRAQELGRLPVRSKLKIKPILTFERSQSKTAGSFIWNRHTGLQRPIFASQATLARTVRDFREAVEVLYAIVLRTFVPSQKRILCCILVVRCQGCSNSIPSPTFDLSRDLNWFPDYRLIQSAYRY